MNVATMIISHVRMDSELRFEQTKLEEGTINYRGIHDMIDDMLLPKVLMVSCI